MTYLETLKELVLENLKGNCSNCSKLNSKEFCECNNIIYCVNCMQHRRIRVGECNCN